MQELFLPIQNSNEGKKLIQNGYETLYLIMQCWVARFTEDACPLPGANLDADWNASTNIALWIMPVYQWIVEI